MNALLNWITGGGGGKSQRKAAGSSSRAGNAGGHRMIRARYDATMPDVHNDRHWAMADSLSARTANSPGVREKLRNRARYEVANNCYARGICNTLADVEIGYGAVIQIPRPPQAPLGQREAAKEVERLFEEWASEVDLWGKLWTLRISKATDGEAFGVFRNNPRLDSLVSLDLQIIEAEQVTHGINPDFDPMQVDGVDVDGYGNVIRYHVLPEHPGDGYGWQGSPMEVPAAACIHWYRVDRPGQVRGVPEITPALPLFAQLRRYTLATLTAAESAADIAAVIKSSIVPQYEEGEDPGIEYLDIHRGMFMTLPDGRDISQLKAEQPTTTYSEFKREILAEIGRCLNMPRAIALGDAAEYNYASGRLDRQAFDRYVETARWQCEQQVLRKVWSAWWAEASRVPGYLPAEALELVGVRRPKWLWRVLGHVDRKKEEDGRATALENNTTTLAEECGREGLWWEDVLEQRAAERERARELGLPTGSGAVGQPSGDSGQLDDQNGAGDTAEEGVNEDAI